MVGWFERFFGAFVVVVVLGYLVFIFGGGCLFGLGFFHFGFGVLFVFGFCLFVCLRRGFFFFFERDFQDQEIKSLEIQPGQYFGSDFIPFAI